MNILEFHRETGVREVLEGVLDCADELAGVMIVVLGKDNVCSVESSALSDFERAYLFQFLAACMNKWIIDGEEEG